MVIGVFKQRLQHEAWHHERLIPWWDGLQLHLNPVPETDSLYLRVIRNILILHCEGNLVLVAACNIAVIGAETAAHLCNALIVLHFRHTVQVIKAVVKEMRVHLRLQKFDLRLINEQLVVIRLFQRCLQLAADAQESLIEKIHIVVRLFRKLENPFLFQILHLTRETVDGL